MFESKFNVKQLDDETIDDSPEKAISFLREQFRDICRVDFEINQQMCKLTLLNRTRDEAFQTEIIFWDIV